MVNSIKRFAKIKLENTDRITVSVSVREPTMEHADQCIYCRRAFKRSKLLRVQFRLNVS